MVSFQLSVTMKVLHVVSSLPSKKKPFDKPFVLSQIESLRRNGVEVDIINLNATRNTFNYVTGIFKIIKTINKKAYDLIHAHYAYCGWSAVFQKRIPIIVSLMGSDLYGIPDEKNRQTVMGLINIISTKILIKFVDAVIVKSKRMRDMVCRNGVFVIPNGVDFEKFRPLKKRQNHDLPGRKTVFFLGNPKLPRKNLPLALKAIEIVKTNNPDVELLAVFGIEQQRVIELMNSSNVFLLTSLREGSPNVIKEAMACNLPIVSTDVGDVREIINNTDGCYITTFNPEDVAEKIQRALDFGKRTNGREHIRVLEINVVARKMISIYEQLLNKT